jgi:hypothetical protein
MQLTSTFLACAVFTGAAIATSNAAAIKADISSLSAYLNQLSGDATQFNSTTTGIPFALQVQIDAVNIDKILQQATQDCQSSSALSDDDSLAIGVQLLSVSDTVTSTLKVIQNKATAFDGLKPIVLNSLYALKADTDTFANALKPKLAAFEQFVAPAIISNLDAGFNSAIKAYGGTTCKHRFVQNLFHDFSFAARTNTILDALD